MAQVKGVLLTIGGKRYVQESPTFEQDMFIMEQAVASGLDTVVLDEALTTDEKDLTPAIKHMLIQAYKRGTLFLLMAAMVNEEGVEWSEQEAHRTAEIFRKVRDPQEKAQLHPALVGALLAFFESGASLKQISSISSESEASGADPELRPKRSARRVLNPGEAAALFSSGRMDRSSVKSPSTKGKSQKTSSR